VQINGHLYGPIPIRRRVRQRCPLSMALFTMCLQPFISMLRRLTGAPNRYQSLHTRTT
jgi:hypothetical protein